MRLPTRRSSVKTWQIDIKEEQTARWYETDASVAGALSGDSSSSLVRRTQFKPGCNTGLQPLEGFHPPSPPPPCDTCREWGRICKVWCSSMQRSPASAWVTVRPVDFDPDCMCNILSDNYCVPYSAVQTPAQHMCARQLWWHTHIMKHNVCLNQISHDRVRKWENIPK